MDTQELEKLLYWGILGSFCILRTRRSKSHIVAILERQQGFCKENFGRLILLISSDYIGTIHGLIYKAICDEQDNIIGWEKKSTDEFNYDLIIIDEASMITSQIWDDLLTFGIPVLAAGDHGQLPPIEGTFNLMDNPVLKLEEIFRQERENPIIKISEIARRYGQIPFMNFLTLLENLKKR